MSLSPTNQTATERRRLRSEIRAWLGTSRADAPTANTTMVAVKRMSELVRLATGGRVSLILMDERTHGCVSPSAVACADNHTPIEQAGAIVLSVDDRKALADMLDCVPRDKLRENLHLVSRIDAEGTVLGANA